MQKPSQIPEKELFGKALHLKPPWYFVKAEFDSDKKQLNIFIDFQRGSTFSFNNKDYKAYDTKYKIWRHLNFFEHQCYLCCRMPRIKPDEGGIRIILPPWAGRHHGFTLLLEAVIVRFCSDMPIESVARLLDEDADKIWRLLDNYIESARKYSDFSKVIAIGMDETSRAKGHDYITLFVDLGQRRTIYIAKGKDNATVKQFIEDFIAHDGCQELIEDISCDMSPAFLKGIKENLPNARITFDKFHIIKLINEAVDHVRKEESHTQPLLKKTKYIFLKNQNNLTENEQIKLENLKLSNYKLKSLRALQIRESFQDIYEASTEQEFGMLLKRWYFWATHSNLRPIIKVAKTIKEHWDGIIEWKRSQINNGILEGLNSVIQATKSKARGYSTFRNFKIIVYLTTGDLDFHLLNPYIPKNK